jgi:hypothetical protein
MKRVLLTLLVLSSLAFAQWQPRYSHGTIFNSGDTITLSIPGNTGTFEELIAGSPATVSIIIKGCMSGGTCDTLETNTTTTAGQNRTPTIATLYDYFTVTGSWTGGTNVSIKVNATTAVK